MPSARVYWLYPASMALSAACRTTAGTSVSHTPCARLTPPTFSHSTDMVRMVDCTMRLATSLTPNMPRTPGSISRAPVGPDAVIQCATGGEVERTATLRKGECRPANAARASHGTCIYLEGSSDAKQVTLMQ